MTHLKTLFTAAVGLLITNSPVHAAPKADLFSSLMKTLPPGKYAGQNKYGEACQVAVYINKPQPGSSYGMRAWVDITSVDVRGSTKQIIFDGVDKAEPQEVLGPVYFDEAKQNLGASVLERRNVSGGAPVYETKIILLKIDSGHIISIGVGKIINESTGQRQITSQETCAIKRL